MNAKTLGLMTCTLILAVVSLASAGTMNDHLVLVGAETGTGNLKAVRFSLDGTQLGTTYLTNGGTTEAYVQGGSEIVGSAGAYKVAVADLGCNNVMQYDLATGARVSSMAISGSPGNSEGLALAGAPTTGTDEWVSSGHSFHPRGWWTSHNTSDGAQTASVMPWDGEGHYREISGADVTSAHEGMEVLNVYPFWQGGTAIEITDSQRNKYGGFRDYFHRYLDVRGVENGGDTVNVIYGDLVDGNEDDEFGIISVDDSGEYWINYYSANLGLYNVNSGVYGGPNLGEYSLGALDFDYDIMASTLDRSYVGAGLVVPEPATLGLLGLGGLAMLRRRRR